MADLWLPFKLLLLFYRMDCVVWLSTTCSVPVTRASEGTNTNTHHLFTFCLVGGFIWADRQMLPLVFRPPASRSVLACWLRLFIFGSDDTYGYISFQWRSTGISSDTQALRRNLAPGYQGPTKRTTMVVLAQSRCSVKQVGCKNHPVICV